MVPDSANKVPDNEQKQKIYRYVSENESITTAETAELLEVKPRRARAVLRNMVNSGCLRKEGVAAEYNLCKKYGREIMQHG